MLVVKLLRRAGMNNRQGRLVVPAWLARGVLTAVLLAFGPATLAAQRVALVIGNAAYQHETTLKNPLRDAELIARTLKDDLRFDVVQRVSNGKRVDLVREIAKFRALAAGAEVAVVYYSGHGMMNSRRQNFLLPVDMPNSSADASADGDVELDANAISEDALIAAVEGAGVQVVVLDACRTNAIVRRGDKNADKGLSRRADQSRKRLIVYATEDGRVAEDGAGANSTFADSLARNLKQTSWPVMKVMTEVANEVERGTKGKQSPTWSGNLRVDIYLVNPTITVNNNLGGSGAPGATTPRSDPDEEAWKAAQGADTVEGYEQYLSDFRTGRNVSAAKIKLAAAKRREAERQAAANAAAARPAPQSTSVSTPTQSATNLQTGQSFRDCQQAHCPEMVVIPAGRFTMGSSADEQAKAQAAGASKVFTDRESPQHEVSVRSFAAGKYAVTKGQFAAFVQATRYKTEAESGDGCFVWVNGKWENQADKHWRNVGFAQGEDHPVVCVSWNDAQAYVKWLSQSTGKQYRLLSESEREYAARGGKQTAFWWGDTISTSQANYNGNYSYNGSAKGEYRQTTVLVNSFQPNAFGLYNVHGNVWEWVQDCFEDNYSKGQPIDGSAHRGNDNTCQYRVLRGGSWFNYPLDLRAANRDRSSPVNRGTGSGFRVARTVSP